MSKAEEYNLRIGDSALIKSGFITKVSLVYAGMPNDRVYSLVVTCSAGHNSMAYNLYIPIDQQRVKISEVNLTIRSVSPTEIRLRTG